MELKLEVVVSSSIKRKKPWPRFCWLGREKESVFLLDDKRISEINMVSGRTKKKTPKLHPLLNSVVRMASSHNGMWLCGLLVSGELFLWNRDKDLLKTSAAIPEVVQMITGNTTRLSLQVSGDGMRVLLIAVTGQVFLWECMDVRDLMGVRDGTVKGQWTHIQPLEDSVMPSEQDKDASQHTIFIKTEVMGDACLSAFVFTSAKKVIITCLKVQWEEGVLFSIGYSIQWATKTYPMSSLTPPCQPVKSRGALVPAFSPDGSLLAIVLNQRQPQATQVLFVSTQNFVSISRGLGGCGSKRMEIPSKYIRSYWVGSVSWSPSGLFLACVLKRGSLLMLSRLGGLLTLSSSGCNVDFGPAHFLPLHPLVTYRPPVCAGNKDASLSSSSLSVRDVLRQRYSVTWHPRLLYLIVSDGYMATVMRVLDKPSPDLLLKTLLKDTSKDLEKASRVLDKSQVLNQRLLTLILLVISAGIFPDSEKDFVKTKRRTSKVHHELGKIQSKLLTAWALGLSLGNAVENRPRLMKHTLFCVVRLAALLRLFWEGKKHTSVSSCLLNLLKNVLSFLPWDSAHSDGPRCLGLMVELSKRLIHLSLTPHPESHQTDLCQLSAQSLSSAVLILQLVSESLDRTYSLQQRTFWSSGEKGSQLPRLWPSDVHHVPMLHDGKEEESSLTHHSQPVPQRPSSRYGPSLWPFRSITFSFCPAADSLPCPWLPVDLHSDTACAVVQTLGRFMASYFTNQPLYILPPHHVAVLPPLHLPHGRLVPLCQEEVAKAVRRQQLSEVWTVDYAQDLLLLGGLLPEAVWLAYHLGDWKTAASLSLAYTSYCSDHFDFTRSLHLPTDLEPESIFQVELECILGNKSHSQELWDKNGDKSFADTLEAEDWDLIQAAMQEILKASVMAGVNVLSSPLSSLLNTAKEMCSLLPAVVPNGLYLPSPPLYCPQPSPNTQFNDHLFLFFEEVASRHKVSRILQRLLLLLKSARCCRPAAQWYISHLRRARHILHKIKKKYSYPSAAEEEKAFPDGLMKFVTRSGFFRRGPNKEGHLDPDTIQTIVCFRELCALCWMLHVRDQLSISCRKYQAARQRVREDQITNDSETRSTCVNALLWACRLLPFSCFLNVEEILQDILLSLLSELPPLSLVAETLVQTFPEEEESVRVPLREKYNSLLQRLRQSSVLGTNTYNLMMIVIQDKRRQRRKHLGRLKRHLTLPELHLWEKNEEEEDRGSKHGMAMLRQLSLGTTLSTSTLTDCAYPPVCSDGDTADNTSEALSPEMQSRSATRYKQKNDAKEKEHPQPPTVGTWEFELEDEEYLNFLELFLSYVLEKDSSEGAELGGELPLLKSFSSQLRERELHSLTFDVLTTIHRRQRDSHHSSRKHSGSDMPVFRAGCCFKSLKQGATPELQTPSLWSEAPVSRTNLSVSSLPGLRSGRQKGLFGLRQQRSVPLDQSTKEGLLGSGTSPSPSPFLMRKHSESFTYGSSSMETVIDLQQGLDPKLDAQFPELGRLLEWMVRWADRRVLTGYHVMIRVKASAPAILTSLSLLQSRFTALLANECYSAHIQIPETQWTVAPVLHPEGERQLERESSVDTGYPGSATTPIIESTNETAPGRRLVPTSSGKNRLTQKSSHKADSFIDSELNGFVPFFSFFLQNINYMSLMEVLGASFSNLQLAQQSSSLAQSNMNSSQLHVPSTNAPSFNPQLNAFPLQTNIPMTPETQGCVQTPASKITQFSQAPACESADQPDLQNSGNTCPASSRCHISMDVASTSNVAGVDYQVLLIFILCRKRFLNHNETKLNICLFLQAMQPLSVQAESPEIQFRESRTFIPPSQGLLTTSQGAHSAHVLPTSTENIQNDSTAHFSGLKLLQLHRPPLSQQSTQHHPQTLHTSNPSKRTEKEKRNVSTYQRRHLSFNHTHDPTPVISQHNIQTSERTREHDFSLLPPAFPAHTPAPMQGLRLLQYEPVPHNSVTFPKIPGQPSSRSVSVFAAPRAEAPIKLLRLESGPKMVSIT
uniref:Ciliogenesis and planar polarity effector 1 n=1 Tax=Labrus bergylta TaxID=56723 RepID=A0A3Q3FV11_9LABR